MLVQSRTPKNNGESIDSFPSSGQKGPTLIGVGSREHEYYAQVRIETLP
jgi:hypothetical protein